VDEQATIKVYDPKVTATQMQSDINYLNTRSEKQNTKYLKTENDPYAAMEGAHAIAVLTEWDEFKKYDWNRIYNGMQKPAFVFDGRNVLDREALETIGFVYKGIGS
jgi:UDPglucose 6-dehydrogenase